jgi:dUTP pyrophosphatase
MIMRYQLHIYCDDNNLFEIYKIRAIKHNNSTMRDSGFDLIVTERIPIFPYSNGAKIDHDIQCIMKLVDNNDTIVKDHCGFYLYPRSSTGTKTPLRLSNSVGIIDPGYRGNIISAFDNVGMSVYTVEAGDRVVQICPPNITYDMDVVLHNNRIDNDTERGEGGFGSSGV